MIGFGEDTRVTRHNRHASRLSGLSPERVIDNPLSTMVAPCMNNFLVAQRFEDARAAGEALDVSLDYVFTLRMRATKVRLPLLASPQGDTRYVVVNRLPCTSLRKA